MKYVILEEAGSLSIRYEGPMLDLTTLGTIQFEIQAMVDRVSLALLAREGIVDAEKPWMMFKTPRPYIVQRTIGRGTNFDMRPVRVMARRIQSQSPLLQELILMVPAVLADSNVRAILQGVIANVLTAIGATGIRGLKASLRHEARPRAPIVDIGPEMRRLAVAIAQNANGQSARLLIKTEEMSVQLEIEADND